MKKNLILKGLLLVILLGGAFGFGYYTKSIQSIEKQQITITKTLTQSTDDVHLDDGDTYIELSDGSWAIYGDKTNMFTFQPVDLGDWDYEAKSHEQLDDIVKTYLSMKNNGYF